MREIPFAVIGLVLVVGCNSSRTVKVDNPVLGPAPPRMEGTSVARGGTAYVNDPLNPTVPGVAPGDIVPTGLGGLEQSGESELAADQVVARVNGTPIFASEVLEPYELNLSQVREKAPPADYRRLRNEIVQRDLEGHIERRLLVQALRSTLKKKEQMEQITSHLEEAFDEEIKKMQERMKVGSPHELDAKLKEQKTSLASLRGSFIKQQMARQFLGTKAGKELRIGRVELIDYYAEHREEYATPLRARWQQIRISFAKHGGKSQAHDVLEKATNELRNSGDFGNVARRYSDGPTAAQGGVWDWTQVGSLADQQIEQALFGSPVGTINKVQVVVGPSAFQLVKVTKRENAGFTPFDELQDVIRSKIEHDAKRQSTNHVIDELRAKATVVTIFDKPSKDERTTERQPTTRDIALPFR
jgi:hypothetical protein